MMEVENNEGVDFEYHIPPTKQESTSRNAADRAQKGGRHQAESQRNKQAPSRGQQEQHPWAIEALKACEKIRDELLLTQMRETVGKIVGLFRGAFSSKEKKSMVFPIHMKSNQQKDLPKFIDELKSNFKEQMEKMRHSTTIYVLTETEIRDIALRIYMELELNGSKSTLIFIARNITDLNLSNIDCLEKGLQNKNFCIVLPTFESLEDAQDGYGSVYEKMHYELYNSRSLFCQFIYRCVASPDVMAYLPAEILQLITDFDYYPLSFREGTRRFMYIFERYLRLCRKPRTFVDFEPLVEKVDRAIRDCVTDFDMETSSNFEKILKVLLSERSYYVISEKVISTQLQLTHAESEERVIADMKVRLQSALKSTPGLQGFCSYLDEAQPKKAVQASKSIKRSRSQRLMQGIIQAQNRSAKLILEDQVTRMLKVATQNIRQQAKDVFWNDFRFQDRIRPELPRHLYDAALNSTDHARIIHSLCTSQTTPISRLIENARKDDIGKLMFLLKDLEVMGLIEVTKNSVKPSVSLNHFAKAYFSRK